MEKKELRNMTQRELEMLSLDEKIEGTKMLSDFEDVKKYLDLNNISYRVGSTRKGFDECIYIVVNPKNDHFYFDGYYSNDELGYEWAILIRDYCNHEPMACIYGSLKEYEDWDYEDPMGCEILSINGNGFYDNLIKRLDKNYILQRYQDQLKKLKEQEEEILAKIKEIES